MKQSILYKQGFKICIFAAIYAGLWILMTKGLIAIGIFPFPIELTNMVLGNTLYSESVKNFLIRSLWMIQFAGPVFLAAFPISFIILHVEKNRPYAFSMLTSLLCFVAVQFKLSTMMPDYMREVIAYLVMAAVFLISSLLSIFLMRRFILRREIIKQIARNKFGNIHKHAKNADLEKLYRRHLKNKKSHDNN